MVHPLLAPSSQLSWQLSWTSTVHPWELWGSGQAVCVWWILQVGGKLHTRTHTHTQQNLAYT